MKIGILFLAFAALGTGSCEAGDRNIDYFTIGQFDTRSGRAGLDAHLEDIKENSERLLTQQWVQVNARDRDGRRVSYTAVDGSIVEFKIRLDYGIRDMHDISLRAIEEKYEFNKLNRDSLGECSHDDCVISKYNCDKEIIMDNKCSIFLISSQLNGWDTSITWANIQFWKNETKSYLGMVSKNLP
ncbi:hypothetical protein [Sinorhizobium medicae]|uniref:hypothetical protein n=1 Tax=Sinorhizobium medicae TaxID=110321 RepID=UPI000FDCC1AF|nr:hypothetical protein [Sinorhizobium medicae]RVJ82701.1 hypothetical protein CN168_10880 [Sinorhizobium medicae]